MKKELFLIGGLVFLAIGNGICLHINDRPLMLGTNIVLLGYLFLKYINWKQ